MISGKKYYWLKLQRDFFKRHDIQIIEDMPNGKDYILFYLKLLCESIDHNGSLRFNEEIPYNEQMLSTITHTNVDIVRSAIAVFTKLKMMELLDDGTYFLKEVNKMLGSESYWAGQKRLQREKTQKEEEDWTNIGQCPTCPSKSIEKELEIDKKIDKENKKESGFVKPTIEEVRQYCKEQNNGVDADMWWNFYESKGWFIGKNKMKSWHSAIATWVRTNNNKPKTQVKTKATPDWYDNYAKEQQKNKEEEKQSNNNPENIEELEEFFKAK